MARLSSKFLSKMLKEFSKHLVIPNFSNGEVPHVYPMLFNEGKLKRDEIIKRFGKVGRKDACPCQSGKKFKKCHGIV